MAQPSPLDFRILYSDFWLLTSCSFSIPAHSRNHSQVLRAARNHPRLQFGIDFPRHDIISESSLKVGIDLHELPEVALRAFNSDLRSKLLLL